eukprot:scaffold2329_cov247-Pinguiococcus_pyrenoidosus.AAC.8
MGDAPGSCSRGASEPSSPSSEQLMATALVVFCLRPLPGPKDFCFLRLLPFVLGDSFTPAWLLVGEGALALISSAGLGAFQAGIQAAVPTLLPRAGVHKLPDVVITIASQSDQEIACIRFIACSDVLRQADRPVPCALADEGLQQGDPASGMKSPARRRD